MYSGFGFRHVVTARSSLGAFGTALAFGGGATFGAALPSGRPRGLLTGTSTIASTIGSGGDSALSSAGNGPTTVSLTSMLSLSVGSRIISVI